MLDARSKLMKEEVGYKKLMKMGDKEKKQYRGEEVLFMIDGNETVEKGRDDEEEAQIYKCEGRESETKRWMDDGGVMYPEEMERQRLR